MNTLDFYKGKRVLVTGHTGFKGSWLCRILVLAGALPAGAAGIRSLGRLAALASLLLFALLCGSSQPELFLCRIGSGGRQRPRRASLDQTGNKMPLAALTGPDPAHFVHIQRQAAGAVCLARAAKAVIHIDNLIH